VVCVAMRIRTLVCVPHESWDIFYSPNILVPTPGECGRDLRFELNLCSVPCLGWPA
jgi:hypothetical protein